MNTGLQICTFWLCMLFSTFLYANEATPPLNPPQGRVILTIKGLITHTNAIDDKGNPVANFDREMLEQLEQTTVRTSTRWDDQIHEYQGVLLADLLKYLGATGKSIEAVALDSYKTPETPIDDFSKYSVIVAIRKDGEYIRIRDKGPARLIYPVDDYTQLKQELLTQYRLIWHLRTIIVK